MPRHMLTGSRIRERRLVLGVRQADLARQVDISASYLNLIEHNRRRIGGKLLVRLAQVLEVEPSMLTEGAEEGLLSALREAGASAAAPIAELDRTEEFASRFPGWAEVLASSHQRVAALERTVEVLSDRLTHDPQLAASLHEMLSTAAAIRSTAGILAENDDLETEWLDRFHQNLNEDAQRLADSSRALVSFLDEENTVAEKQGMPQDEVDRFLSDHGFHFPALEQGSETPASLIAAAPQLKSQSARQIAQRLLEDYESHMNQLPLHRLLAAVSEIGMAPDLLALHLGVQLEVLMQRLALLAEEDLGSEIGCVVSDAAGASLLRRSIGNFSIPQYGAACPLWPLYQALSQPHIPIKQVLQQQGRGAPRYMCYAYGWHVGDARFDSAPQVQAVMLIFPLLEEEANANQVGVSCRVCTREACDARREPTILTDGF
ncbi:helix-turn-helix domain-containing protein [Epibacterium sp. SM1969]|uniref:Helix-turn-helix domain-containing protein n=1 Tax=Tritonibacter aquimaris TaxID=2663379 RepID=A0A844AYI5_9RHOB|nr:helix-turn-helix transcriptional regulator [Tritonibacter aquimaris]MQY43022.1 helix-turn-helix domain-containing protein [Tritonibacter aquimaris]